MMDRDSSWSPARHTGDAEQARRCRRVADNAAETARILRALANAHRLLVMCHLDSGERSVSELLEAVPLSQSALSQHLAVLRNEGLVATRRSAQIVYYRIADERVRRLLPLLDELECRGDGAGS